MDTFTTQASGERDDIAQKLKSSALAILTIAFGLLPLFFIPLAAAPLGYSKVLLIIFALVFALILYSLYVLRTGGISFCSSYALITPWVVFLISLLSTILSGDFKDAFVGDVFSIHSTAFLGVLAVTATIWTFIGADKVSVIRLYFLLAISTVALTVFHLLRLFFGADALTFGIFNNSVSTPIGGWNDLALFFGLSILLALVALQQLPLTKWGARFFGAVAAAALIMLAIINFMYIWIVLAVVSLVAVIYIIKKPRQQSLNTTVFPGAKKAEVSVLVLSLVVFATSVLFTIGGSSMSGFVNNLTGISFVEVRPSFESTTGIIRGVYTEDAFLGIGTNKFADAWRAHKDERINTTIFWNTDFNAGSGYIPTFFATTGVLGGLAWLVFLGSLLMVGVRMLTRAADGDRLWYFIGTSSFVGAVYVWSMSMVYVPGPTILMLGALCTGITFLAHSTLTARESRTFAMNDDRRLGFIFTFAAIVIIIGSISILYTGTRHYAAAYTFNDAAQSAQAGVPLEEIETRIVRAHELSENDLYLRRLAEFQLARMNALFAVESPTQVQQQQFNQALSNGINAGQLATQHDDTEPANWAVLGQIYSLLVSANVEGSYDRALEALQRAQELDRSNPSRDLALANLEARAGNLTEAKQLAESSVAKKQNYTDGFFFLTQIAVAEGNTAEALATARSIISLEPNNPARHYQLGVLESSQGNLEAAATAFEDAVRLDQDYANAMYFLALTYDALGRSGESEQLLRRVLELNPGNQNVSQLIEQLETTGSLNTQLPDTDPVGEAEATVSEEDGVVTTDEDPDNPVVTPINAAPDNDDASQTEAQQEEGQPSTTNGNGTTTNATSSGDGNGTQDTEPAPE